MRSNWILENGTVPNIEILQSAVKAFYDKYKVVPDRIKLTYKDYSSFITGFLYQQAVVALQREKRYGIYIMIPGGMAELFLLDEDDEAVVNNLNNHSIIVVENTKVDREFEKHVLNKDE